jgi:hypothetical protein
MINPHPQPFSLIRRRESYPAKKILHVQSTARCTRVARMK